MTSPGSANPLDDERVGGAAGAARVAGREVRDRQDRDDRHEGGDDGDARGVQRGVDEVGGFDLRVPAGGRHASPRPLPEHGERRDERKGDDEPGERERRRLPHAEARLERAPTRTDRFRVQAPLPDGTLAHDDEQRDDGEHQTEHERGVRSCFELSMRVVSVS